MTTLKDKKTGKKMYPVGHWEKYQHVFYNASDRAYNALYDAQETGTALELEEAEKQFDRAQDLLNKWESNPQINGIVYASYEDYRDMKNIIGGYAYRHGGRV